MINIEKLPVYDWVMKNNKGNNNPYHNNIHLKRVTNFFIDGISNHYYTLDYINMFITASLFHDFNHKGVNTTSDSDNIKLAIDGFLEYNNTFNKIDHSVTIIIDLIKSTEYPYKHNNLTQIEQLLRDSDILQGFFTDDYIDDVVYPLADELYIDRFEMLNNQFKFLDNLEFGTKWAQNKFESVKDSLKLRVNREININKILK